MKKLLCFVSVIVLVALSIVTAFAHSGRTDGKGGHYDRSTGEYHYHHGYSAHQHKNGVCPYDDNEKTTIGNYEYAEKLFKQNNSVVAENESFEVPWYIWAIAGLVILLIPIAITIKKAKKKVTPKKEEPQKEIISNTKPEEDCYIAYKRGYEPSNYIAGSLFQSYIVGKDIPEGETVFSARSKRNGNITIYKSNDEIILQERIDFTKSFRVYLKTGEKVNTFNCRWKSTNAPIERSEEE